MGEIGIRLGVAIIISISSFGISFFVWVSLELDILFLSLTRCQKMKTYQKNNVILETQKDGCDGKQQ